MVRQSDCEITFFIDTCRNWVGAHLSNVSCGQIRKETEPNETLLLVQRVVQIRVHPSKHGSIRSSGVVVPDGLETTETLLRELL